MSKQFLIDHASSRLFQLVAHLFPSSPKTQTNKQIQTYKQKHSHKEELSYLICANFVGDTRHLKISNAEKYLKEFHEDEQLQHCLLNANHDVSDFANFVAKWKPNLQFSIFGNIEASELNSNLTQLRKTLQNRSLIFYWSGHGKLLGKQKELGICLAQSHNIVKETVVPFTEILSWTDTGGHRLFVLECCHSGAALRHGKFGDSHVLLLAACSQNEVSGGWIMDGSDSGGIMTKFLIDPIRTLYKVLFGVFCELLEEQVERLYLIYEKYAVEMMKCLEKNVLDVLYDCGMHVVVLYRNFLLFLKYGHLLLRPQTGVSFPSMSKCIELTELWNKFEKEFEDQIIKEEEYRLKLIQLINNQ